MSKRLADLFASSWGIFTQFNSSHNTITNCTIINIGRHSILLIVSLFLKVKYPVVSYIGWGAAGGRVLSGRGGSAHLLFLSAGRAAHILARPAAVSIFLGLCRTVEQTRRRTGNIVSNYSCPPEGRRISWPGQQLWLNSRHREIILQGANPMSGVFQNRDPSPPLHPASVYCNPRLWCS